MAIKYTDYLITPTDIYRGVLYLKNNIRRRDFVGIIILALVFSYINHLGWQIDSSIFFCFFIAIFFWNLDSRISIALALIFLTSCPFLLIAYNDYNFLWGEDWAETAAVWTYYLLVSGVVKQMWDFRKEGEDANTPPHPNPLPQGAREKIDTNVDTQSEKAKRECWIPASVGMTNAGTRKKDKIKIKTVDLASFIKYMEKKRLVLDIRDVRKKRDADSRRGLFSKGKGEDDTIR